jgi:hypothetical protein
MGVEAKLSQPLKPSQHVSIDVFEREFPQHGNFSEETLMSTAPISATSSAQVSASSTSQQLQSFFQQRKTDLQQLRGALESGDLAGAQKGFKSIQQLASVGPSPTGNAFAISQRQQDYSAVGQALTSGNLAGAQQAFAQLVSDFHHNAAAPSSVGPAVVVNISEAAAGSGSSQSTSSTSSTAGPELTINIGNSSTPENVTIGISNTSAGEQLSISVAGQQGSKAENITLNLGQSSNEQIVINLLNAAQQSTTEASSQGTGVNLTA